VGKPPHRASFNQQVRTQVFKNLLTLSSGELVARGILAVAFIVLARALGKDAFGEFGLATAVTSYGLLLVSLGFDPIATREVSRSVGELKQYATHILLIRVACALVAVAATAAYVFGAAPAPAVGRLLLVLSFSYVANALTPRWAFLALEESRPLAVAGLITPASLLAAAVLIHMPSQVAWAAIALVSGELAAGVLLLRALVRRVGALTFRPDWTLARTLARQSWPVTLSLLLSNMLYNFDVLALGAMRRATDIGIYLACYRCVTVFSPFLNAFQAAAYPSLARSYPDFERIRVRVRWLTLSAIGVLMLAAMIIAGFAHDLLGLLYGSDYVEGAPILRILVWTLPIQGFRSLLRQVLVAFHRQHWDARNVAVAVATNVVMDVLLIPQLGALGCAISTLASEVVFAALSAVAVRAAVRHVPAVERR